MYLTTATPRKITPESGTLSIPTQTLIGYGWRIPRGLLKMVWRGLLFAVAVFSASKAGATEIQEKDVALLPIKSLRAVVADGEQVFMSENGRFVIKGELYDVWQKKRITDFAEMRALATHIDLKKIGLDVTALNTVSMGTGTKEVVIFVAPFCRHCQILIQKAKQLTSSYRFRLVFISGDEAVQKIIKNIVGAAEPSVALEAVANNSARSLPDIANSDPKKNALTMLTAQLMDVDRVPFVIAPNGRFHKGLPQNLQTWLEAQK